MDSTIFTIQDMEQLVDIQMARYEVIEAVKTLAGEDVGVSFQDGALSKLQYVYEIISRHSVGSDEEVDYKDGIGKILDDPDLSSSEKARKLMEG